MRIHVVASEECQTQGPALKRDVNIAILDASDKWIVSDLSTLGSIHEKRTSRCPHSLENSWGNYHLLRWTWIITWDWYQATRIIFNRQLVSSSNANPTRKQSIYSQQTMKRGHLNPMTRWINVLLLRSIDKRQNPWSLELDWLRVTDLVYRNRSFSYGHRCIPPLKIAKLNDSCRRTEHFHTITVSCFVALETPIGKCFCLTSILQNRNSEIDSGGPCWRLFPHVRLFRREYWENERSLEINSVSSILSTHVTLVQWESDLVTSLNTRYSQHALTSGISKQWLD